MSELTKAKKSNVSQFACKCSGMDFLVCIYAISNLEGPRLIIAAKHDRYEEKICLAIDSYCIHLKKLPLWLLLTVLDCKRL